MKNLRLRIAMAIAPIKPPVVYKLKVGFDTPVVHTIKL